MSTVETMQQRRDTAANWTAANPVPFSGEWCKETDTGLMKSGDGVTAWTSLPYFTGPALPVLKEAAAAVSGALAANTLTEANAASGNLVMTLPAPAAGVLITCEKSDSSANTVSVTGNIRGTGGVTILLQLQYESVTLLGYSGSWWVLAGHKTLSSLQALFLQKASNLSDLASPAAARTSLGLGTAATAASSAFDAAGAASTAQTASLQKSANLSDLANAATGRTNLGVAYGTAAGTVAQGNDSRLVSLAVTQETATSPTSGSALTLNLANGLTQLVTLTAACTFTFSNWPSGASQVTVVCIENSTGGWVPTFPSGVTWIGSQPAQNTAPSTGISVYCFLSPDGGTTVYGAGTVNSAQGAAGVDIFDWYTSAGTLVASVDSTGRAHFGSGITTGGNIYAGTTIYGNNANTVANAQDSVTAGATEVNFVNFNNAAAGSAPGVSAGSEADTGSTPDANVDFDVTPLGTGNVNLGGPAVTTIAPTGGTTGTLPAHPTGYIQIKFNGTQYKIAVY
jgi:Major tropism determinant N-terminal domain